jgi:hypothetical protein
MFANTIWRPGLTGRMSKSIRMAGLVLAAVFAVSLAASDQARAADCTTANACFTSAEWQNAVANDDSNKAAWFREMSRQNFISAKEWGDKATLAFHAGDATAAAWYKAIADDYSQKAVANAKAADDYTNQATFIKAAAYSNILRGMFIMTANASQGCPLQTADAGGSGDIVACTASAQHKDCLTQPHPSDPSWGTVCEGKYAAVCDADQDGHKTYVDYYPNWSYQTKPSYTAYDSYGRTDGKFCHHETLSDAQFEGVERFRVCVQTEGCSQWRHPADP